MKTTFLGHGLNSENKHNVGKQLATSFESQKYNSFNGFVAFASIAGVRMLVPYIKKAEKKIKPIRFFIGVDNRGTSKEALELLLKENIETYIYYDKKDYITYHPKLFIFEGDKHSRVIIGSSNLTSQGIKNNIEASIQLDIQSKNDKQGQKLISEIKDYFSNLINLSSKHLKLLTQELLEQLINDNLLFHQFHKSGKVEEQKNNDGENLEEQNSIEITEFDIDTGIEQNEKIYRQSSRYNFGENDYETFDIFLNRYVIYKKNERPSGIVSKHTDDRELFYWYRKMNGLYNENSLPIEILNRLLEVDFPFKGVGRERKRLIKWNEYFNNLIEYKNKVDPNSIYTHVPQFRNKSNPYYKLGLWCSHQKQRRKGNDNYPPKWSQYEEDKMNSINFIWEGANKKGKTKDDVWTDNLVELEKYYSIKKNYITVPSQKTKIGKWLNDQMTLKFRQDKNKSDKIFISEIRVEMLGNLLNSNGVEWEWEKQKHRLSIEKKIEHWKILERIIKNGEINEYKEKNKKLLKKYRVDVAQLRSQSKKWNNEKNKWKFEILDKAGFPYEKH